MWRRYELSLHGDAIALSPAVIAGLPATATGIIGPRLALHRVTARRVASLAVDETLRLAVFHVDPLDDRDEAAAEPPLASGSTRAGARREILDAISAVLTRSGGDTFTPAEIVAEMARRNTGYAETTIRTMITGHLCRNAPDNAGTTYDDLERVGHGRYRLWRS